VMWIGRKELTSLLYLLTAPTGSPCHTVRSLPASFVTFR
jgi:hypothetical protein